MIELFSIKKYNNYDYIQDDMPSGSGTWLCSKTDGDYVRGYSYDISSGEAVRYDQVNDIIISSSIYPLLETVCENINNWFYVGRQNNANTDYSGSYDGVLSDEDMLLLDRYESTAGTYTFSSGVISGITDNNFIVNDLVRIKNSMRNNLMSYITASSSSITINNDNSRDCTENAFILLCSPPRQFEETISRMINYDVYARGVPSDLISETIGSYSYSKDNKTMLSLGSLQYPAEFITVLNSYKNMRYIS